MTSGISITNTTSNTTDLETAASAIWTYISDTAGSTYHTHTWDLNQPHVDWGPPVHTRNPHTIEWDFDYIPTWLPMECMCCGKNISVEEDGLHLKIGDETMWFHRQCFVNRKYARFIRSLIVTKDLGIL